MATLKKAKHEPAYFAMLARVGHQKKKALAYRDEMEFYSGIATDLLATLAEAVELLQASEAALPQLHKPVSLITSKQHSLIRELLNYWPTSMESQERISNLLESDGLVKVLADTDDGYVTLSGALVLENVGRIFEATREEIRSQSSG